MQPTGSKVLPMENAAARRTDTHCPYCALQCAMTIVQDGDRLRVEPREFPTNRGGLCQKGWTSTELLRHPERLTTPLVRVDGELLPATWDDALDAVAAAVRRTVAGHGSHAVGIFGGGGLTNEKAYAYGKFARVALRSRSIDYNGRYCMSSAAAATNAAFGVDRGFPFPIDDVANGDVIVLAGANVAETMPPFARHLNDMLSAGGRLIVIDPRHTATARLATVHLQSTPGTDLALALGLLHVILAEGLADAEFVERRTSGFPAVQARVASWWPERVERVCGVAADDVRRVARMIAAGRRVLVLTARGAEQHAGGSDSVNAFVNLALALGLPGRIGSGYASITGQGNGQGGREHGQKADQLPGYRRIDDAVARHHIAGVWGVPEESIPGPGQSAYEMLDGIGTADGIRMLLVAGSNPIVSSPNASHVEARLRALDFLVVADPFLSETAALADVVLPVTQWAEEDGTTTNLEGRVIRRRKALDPPAGVRSDLELLAGLAQRLGQGRDFPADAFVADPSAVFDELARASAGGIADYSGMSYLRLDETDGLFWPCPDAQHTGTPRLFGEDFGTVDRRAHFIDVEPSALGEQVDANYPLLLTTGRVLAQYQSGTQTRRVGALRAAAPNGFVEMAPGVAEGLGVVDGEDVRVVSRRGTATAPARISDAIRHDTLFMPFHWPDAQRANSLTSDALDPRSRMPSFKACAVRLERVQP